MSEPVEERNVDSYTKSTKTTTNIYENRIERVTTVDEKYSGEPAVIYAQAKAEVEAEMGKAAVEGIKGVFNIIGKVVKDYGVWIALAGYALYKKPISNTPAASTPGKAVAADTKIPVDHNVPGNGGGTA